MKAAKNLLLVLLLISAINVHAWPVPDTGKTKCYNNTTEIPCPQRGQPFYGQDGNYTINPPSYTKLDAIGNVLPDNAESWVMIRDNVTGLIWENKTSDGSIHDGGKTFTWCDRNLATNGGNPGTCSTGTGNAATDMGAFIKALNDVKFGGFSDWRMPNVKELMSIADVSRYSPAINMTWFPSTVLSYYWSSTASTGNFDIAWCVNFGYGAVSNYYKANAYAVRAVRGGQFPLLNHLVDNGDGTVTDTYTGFMWQQGTGTSTMTWDTALKYAEGLSLARYNDWRLPTPKELQTIVDYSHYNPAIDTGMFPGAVLSYYWSSTTDASSGDSAWCVNFSSGGIDGSYKPSAYAVRAVRGGRPELFGDVDMNGVVNLADAILALQTLASSKTVVPVYREADADGDNKIGMAEAIYALQCAARLRNNHSPALTSIGNKTVDENTLLTFNVSAKDSDGDAPIYSATNLPSGAQLDAKSGAFLWTPSFDQSGSYQVTITAGDGFGGADSQTITITVPNVNRVPILNPIGNKSVEENTILSFTTSAFDPDGDTLTYSTSSLPDGATFDAGTKTFTWTPTYSQSGAYPVTFTVSDDYGGSASETVNIVVNNKNRAPILASIGNKNTAENSTLTFSIAATDADGDPITYSAASLPSGATFNASTKTFTWTPTYSQSGTYSVTFTVNDSYGGTASEMITISVIDKVPVFTASDYYPLNVNDWIELKNDATGTVRRSSITGVKVINGVTTKMASTGDGTIRYRTSDASGVKDYGFNSPSFTGDIIYSSPLTIAASVLQVGSSQTSSTVWSFSDNGTIYHVDYTVTTTVLGLEDITTALSILKDCIKWSTEQTVTIRETGETATETSYAWFYKGVGVVKQVTSTKSETIIAAYVNGIQLISPSDTAWGMVLIPAGSFQMGNATDGDPRTIPVHTVTLSAFFLDKYEVTKTLWDEVYAWATTHGYSFDRAGSGTASNHPVQTVTWYDVVKWLNARSEKEGRTPVYYTDVAQTVIYQSGQVDVSNSTVKWTANGYRLPTEAEWEYAARAGTTTRYYTGDCISTDQANYNGNNPEVGCPAGQYRGGTTGVGSFAANPWGLYDIAGNVWEWTWDWYGDVYSPSSVTNPKGPDSGSFRLYRGGSWNSNAKNLRSADRIINTPSSNYNFIGFRSALNQP